MIETKQNLEAREGDSPRTINRAVVERLTKLDPRLTVVYQNYRRDFGGDCSAPQLLRHLQTKGYSWADVTRRTIVAWLNEVRQIEIEVVSEHQSGH